MGRTVHSERTDGRSLLLTHHQMFEVYFYNEQWNKITATSLFIETTNVIIMLQSAKTTVEYVVLLYNNNKDCKLASCMQEM